MAEKIDTNKAKEILERETSQAEEVLRDPAKVNDLLDQVEQKLKDVPVLGSTLTDIPLLISMIKGYITKEYTDISPKVIASIVAAILYLVKKKDLIPDNIPVVGVADDIAVMGLALKLSEPELKAYAEWKKGAGNRKVDDDDDDDKDNDSEKSDS